MGKIICHLARLAKEKGIKNSNRLRAALDNRISQPTLKKLWDNRGRAVRFSDADILCERLECKVGELFEKIEADESLVTTKHE